ncbi:MAG TPA: hypothetical protein VIS72_16360 [Anaerolineales bacterium]
MTRIQRGHALSHESLGKLQDDEHGDHRADAVADPLQARSLTTVFVDRVICNDCGDHSGRSR